MLQGHLSLYFQVLWCALVSGQEWDVNVPARVSALTGSCVVIPCSFTHPATGTPQDASWYQYSMFYSPLVYSSSKPQEVVGDFRGRTALLGRVPSGTCSLLINGTVAEHNGQQIYPWIDDADFKYNGKTVTLEVTDNADKPQMTISGDQKEGGAVRISCEVTHSCPARPPSLSFGDQRGEVQGNHTEESEGRWRVHSTVTFTASAEDHGKTAACTVTHPGGQTATAEAVLDVSYAPRSVRVTGEQKVVQLGTDVSLTCASDANPPAGTFAWYRLRDDLGVALNRSTATAAITALEPDENAFHCTAINTLGRANSSTAYVITAEYQPTISASSACSYHTGYVHCRCRARARPVSTVLWRVDGHYPVFSSASAIYPMVHMAEGTWDTTGANENVSVTCVANNTHGQVERLLKVLVKAPPTNVTISQVPSHPVEGDTITLSCLAESHPPASSYRWYRLVGERAVLLRGDSRSLVVLEVTRGAVVFLCSAVNEMGETSSPTMALNVEYAPVILPLSSCSMNNEIARCECVVDSHPVANVIWTPWSIQEHQTHNVTDLLNLTILRSVLIGQAAGHMGGVHCNATNEHGSASLLLPFIGERSGRLSLLYRGVGVALLLFISLILIFGILRRQKRNQRHGGTGAALEELQMTHEIIHDPGIPEARVHWI